GAPGVSGACAGNLRRRARARRAVGRRGCRPGALLRRRSVRQPHRVDRRRLTVSRAVRYRDIAENLRDRVAAGEFGAGRLLPSEAELSDGYEVSRVTVRRALELLRDEGLIDARQGLGWFVATDPLRQTLGRLATI